MSVNVACERSEGIRDESETLVYLGLFKLPEEDDFGQLGDLVLLGQCRVCDGEILPATVLKRRAFERLVRVPLRYLYNTFALSLSGT